MIEKQSKLMMPRKLSDWNLRSVCLPRDAAHAADESQSSYSQRGAEVMDRHDHQARLQERIEERLQCNTSSAEQKPCRACRCCSESDSEVNPTTQQSSNPISRLPANWLAISQSHCRSLLIGCHSIHSINTIKSIAISLLLIATLVCQLAHPINAGPAPVASQHRTAPTQAVSIEGSNIPCSNEGEPVVVPFLVQYGVPNISCTCIHSEVVCKLAHARSTRNRSPIGRSSHRLPPLPPLPGKSPERNGLIGSMSSSGGASQLNMAASALTSALAHCKRVTCPTSLPCPPSFWTQEPNECCPRCRRPEEQQALCRYGDMTYKDGEKWPLSRCKECTCQAGQVFCVAMTCSSAPTSCPAGQVLQQATDSICCPQCVEGPGQCSIRDLGTGDFAVSTFDRYKYNFTAKCNYVLARECARKSFAIHLVNEILTPEEYAQVMPIRRRARTTTHLLANATTTNVNSTGQTNETVTSSTVTAIVPQTALVIRFRHTKVRISATGHVRVGRKRVALPYIKLRKLSIINSRGVIQVRLENGMIIKWNGTHLDMISNPKHKAGAAKRKPRLCGLCGNYNGDPTDELTTKKGVRQGDLTRFVSSWKIRCKRDLTLGSALASNASSSSGSSEGSRSAPSSAHHSSNHGHGYHPNKRRPPIMRHPTAYLKD